VKINDEFKNEYEIPDKILNTIHKEEFKNFQLIKCFGEYPSSIVLKTNKRKTEEVSDEDYRKRFNRELKKMEKCVFKCKLRNKCLFVSMLAELRELRTEKVETENKE
jgi:hypothetical protein